MYFYFKSFIHIIVYDDIDGGIKKLSWHNLKHSKMFFKHTPFLKIDK